VDKSWSQRAGDSVADSVAALCEVSGIDRRRKSGDAREAHGKGAVYPISVNPSPLLHVMTFTAPSQLLKWLSRVVKHTQNELNLKELPDKMSDPNLQPAFCPKIRRAAVAFPRTAQDILARNGLDVEQFEDMQRRLQRNPLFRMQVEREIRRLEKQQ
jgi:hypothetical protein